MRLTIKKWGINGEGIAFEKGKPVFVPGAIVGEVVDAKTHQVIQTSSLRHHPMCAHYHVCGGCPSMHVNYKGQVRMKEALISQALKKYAHYQGPIQPLIKNPSVLAYRNAFKLPIVKNRTGMYSTGSQQFVGLDRCLVHEKKLEAFRQAFDQQIKEDTITHWQGLVAKCFDDQLQVILVTKDEAIHPEIRNWLENHPGVVSLWQCIQPKRKPNLLDGRLIHLAHAKTIDFQFNQLEVSLRPKAFFQLNGLQASHLYEQVASLAKGRVLEAYCGVGIMSMMAANHCQSVLGVDWVEDAIESAHLMAKKNGVQNVDFICQDAAKVVLDESIETLIVDPPRSGLDARLIDSIQKALPERIIYVSCNPSTLGKNLAELTNYRIDLVQPYDFFSQTAHVETLVLLTRVH